MDSKLMCGGSDRTDACYIAPSTENDAMVSDTKKSWNRREAKTAKLGRKQKKIRTKAGTPKFPVHPEGKPTAAGKES